MNTRFHVAFIQLSNNELFHSGAVLENMQIRAGSTTSLSGGVVRNIARFVKHPDYTEAPRSNDLAVTFVEPGFGITNEISTLFLPPYNWNIADGQSVKIVSWGFESVSFFYKYFYLTFTTNVKVCEDGWLDGYLFITLSLNY